MTGTNDILVSLQKTVIQLSARVEALERIQKAQADKAAAKLKIPVPRKSDTIPMHSIMRRVADAYGVDIGAMKGQGKTRHLTDARECFAKMASREGFSSTQIGKVLGGRDHTTILALLNRGRVALPPEPGEPVFRSVRAS